MQIKEQPTYKHWRTTGPARLINTTDMPPVVLFNVSAHVFFFVKKIRGQKHTFGTFEKNVKNEKLKNWEHGKMEHTWKIEKMETFSCTKFLNRLFRPLRDEMLASRWSIASAGLLLLVCDSPISTDDFTHVSCIFRLHLFSHIFPKKVTLCLCSTILHNANKPLYSLHYILCILRLPLLVVRRTWGVL